MVHVRLNEQEVAILRSAARKGDASEEYSAFIESLSHMVDPRTFDLWLGPEHLASIHKFAFQSHNMTWQAALVGILGRLLGKDLGLSRENTGRLSLQ